MSFTITLTPPVPSDAVLLAEKALSGLEFLSTAESCLRCHVDAGDPQTHQTLGRLTTYSIELPDKVAISSGLFTSTNEVYVVVPNDALKNYIFYTAEKRTVTAAVRTSVYPYYKDGTVISSRIDEFAFLDTWEKYGYSTNLVGLIEGTESSNPGTGSTSGSTSSSGSSGGCGCGPICNAYH